MIRLTDQTVGTLPPISFPAAPDFRSYRFTATELLFASPIIGLRIVEILQMLFFIGKLEVISQAFRLNLIVMVLELK